MKSPYIRKIAVAVALLCTCTAPTVAQDLTSYFMTDAIERKSHNAALAPDRGYFNFPLIGATSLALNGNISLGQMLFPIDGNLVPIFDTRVSAADALSGLNDVNFLGFENKITLLGFGSYTKNHKAFWSFDLSLRTSSSFSMPYELFDFVKSTPDRTSIENINIYLESYVETAIGYSRPINDKITVGGRAKLLVGVANMSLGIDQMDLVTSGDVWSATASGSLNINASGVSIATTKNEDGVDTFELGDIEFSPESMAGYGAAIDLGASYDFSDRLRFSISANDIGFIAWSRENNTSASVSNSFEFTGAKVDIDNDSVDSNTDGVELGELEFVEEASESQTKWLQANINAAAEYGFFGDRIGVGAIYSARLWRAKTLHNITTAVTLRPTKWFTLAASYAFTNNNANAVGLAANIATGFINLYVASDVLTSRKSAQYIPIEQSMMNFTFGLAFPLGPKGERRSGI